MAVPATMDITCVFQDERGFKAHSKLTTSLVDISTAASTLAQLYTGWNAYTTALAAASNAKLVGIGVTFSYDWAQEPTTKAGTYPWVQQKAILHGGTGKVMRNRLTIPAPADSLFLTTGSDNLTVVNPASTELTAITAATSADFQSPDGGTPFTLFFGGQLVNSKAPRRRVLQGA